jgi:branched-chain amino acid transport system substrate-binding protein
MGHVFDMEMAPRALALVQAAGAVEEIDDSHGARLIRQYPEVLRYAQGFLRADLASASFAVVVRRRSWLLVQLARVERPLKPTAALVELEQAHSAPFDLTARELDVLTLLAAGLTNPEIAERLVASRKTIAHHVERVLSKLGQRSRAGAAAHALEQGLVRLPLPRGNEGFEHLAVGRIAIAAGDVSPADTRLAIPAEIAPARQPTRVRPQRRPLRIGLGIPATPGDRDQILNGSLLAIAEINGRGGISGRTVDRVVVELDIDSPARIREGLRSLVEADVDAIALGYTFAEDSSLYEPVSDYGCPVLNSMTSEAQTAWVQDDPARFGNVFQVSPTEAFYGVEFFRYLQRLVSSGQWLPPNRRIISIQTPVSAGQVLDARAIASAEQLGWEIADVVEVANHHADWEPALARIHALEPAAVLVTHFVPRELAALQRRFVESPTPTLVYCIYAPSIPEYALAAGKACDGVLWSTMTGTYEDTIGQSFAQRYAALFGCAPGHSASGIAYDQVNLLALAWSGVDNPRAFHRVSDELRRVVHRGVNGVYALGNARQAGLTYPCETPDPSVAQAHLVFQVHGDTHRIVSPDIYANAQFVAPPWLGRVAGS